MTTDVTNRSVIVLTTFAHSLGLVAGPVAGSTVQLSLLVNRHLKNRNISISVAIVCDIL